MIWLAITYATSLRRDCYYRPQPELPVPHYPTMRPISCTAMCTFPWLGYQLLLIGVGQSHLARNEIQNLECIMFLGPSRIATIGFVIFALYGQRNYIALYTVMAAVAAYVGLVDSYLCWLAGGISRAGVFSSACEFTVDTCGFAGCTASGKI